MVLLVWPPAEHLWIGRNRGQFAPYDAARWPLRRTTLAQDPGSTRPERHFPSGAAQTRVVSAARIRLDPRKSVRSYKGIIYGGISEFESYMPSHAVRSLGASSGLQKPATQPGVQPCPRCPIPPSPSTTADIKLRPTKNSAKQLTNAEWLASFPGTDTQKKALLNCIS